MKVTRPVILYFVLGLILITGATLIYTIQSKLLKPTQSTNLAIEPVEMMTGESLSRTRLARSFGQLPLLFVENQGQWDDQVAYAVQGSEKTLYFTTEGVTFALTSQDGIRSEPEPPCFDRTELGQNSGQQDDVRRWVVKLDFIGANPEVSPVGKLPDEAIISYFKGQPDNWLSSLPTYRRIVYEELWPGIDLIYEGTVNRLKYHFVVQPGADPNQIQMAYRGATEVSVNAAGQLVVSTPLGSFQDDAPVAYQMVDGKRRPVNMSYSLETAEQASQAYHFDLGAYDPSLPLILDPAVLVYAGYIGGGSGDYPGRIAVDDAGNTYVVGTTESSEATFPVTVGPDLTYNGGNSDGFVVKINPQGSGLIYAGYIGGTDDDAAVGIDVDSNGNAYITGDTLSDESSFPISGGPDLTHNGDYDGFVMKINSAGTGVVYSGYIGGASFDGGGDIVVDSSGNAYLIGSTNSTEATFPVMVGPDLNFNGSHDTFVAKINPAGTALDYAGYIGGDDWDSGRGLAVDLSGNAYVTGFTCSTEATFPVTVGPDLTFGGYEDGFVVKVNQSGTALVYAGFIGGINGDRAFDIAVDGNGSAYVTGSTHSDEGSFPVTIGPDLTFNGNGDAFVVKVNPTGTTLDFAGYIGGSEGDIGLSLAIDDSGNAYIAGETSSNEMTFPVSDGPDLTYNGGTDSFVAVVNSGGADLMAAGYIGGNNYDSSTNIAIDSLGDIYVIGQTSSNELTFPVTVGPDLTFNGIYDVYVAKVRYGVTVVAADFTGDPITGTVPLTVTFSNLSTGDFDTCVWDFGDGGTSADCDLPDHNYTVPGVYTVTLTVSGLGGTDTLTRVGYITVNYFTVYVPVIWKP